MFQFGFRQVEDIYFYFEHVDRITKSVAVIVNTIFQTYLLELCTILYNIIYIYPFNISLGILVYLIT